MKRVLWFFVCIPLLVACSNTTEVANEDETDTVVAESNSAETVDSVGHDTDAHVAESEPALSAAEKFEALVGEFDSKMNEFRTAYSEASEDERSGIFQKLYPRPEKFSGRFIEIAEQHSDDPVAVQALSWVASRARGPQSQTAIETLLEKHIDSEELTAVCFPLMQSMGAEAQEQLQTLIDKSPHDKVRGMATYCLASRLRSFGDQHEANNKDEYVALFKKVVSDYSDVEFSGRSIAKMAEGSLFEIEKLSIGSEAPDIEGDDLDGVAFKLSDYRGKVVLLDFWGDW